MERERKREIKKSDSHQKWSEVVEFCDDFLSDVALDQERYVVQNFFFFFFFFLRGVKSNSHYSEMRYSRTDCIKALPLATLHFRHGQELYVNSLWNSEYIDI